MAANDYQTVILASERPAPALHRASAFALIRAGDEHYCTAMEVLFSGAIEKLRETGELPGLLSGQWPFRLAAEPDPGNRQAAAIDILDNFRD